MKMDDKLKLIQQYDNLIKSQVRAYSPKISKLNDIDKEDLESEIKLYMLKRLDNIDTKRDISAYMKKIVECACITYFVTRERNKREGDFTCDSLDKKVKTDEEEKVFGDLIGSDYDLEEKVIKEMITKDIFDYVRENKNRNVYLMFKLYFADCLTYEEIGNIMGVSRQRVGQVLGRLIRVIRANFRMAYN